jgi:Flp pilus assembly protein TadG
MGSFSKILRQVFAGGFLSSESGVTAVEVALLAPAFLGASLVLVEIGLYELYSGSLSYATQSAARQVLLGNVANGPQPVTLANFINNYLCPSLPPPMTCDRIIVNSQVMTTEQTSQGASAWWTLMNASQTWLATVPMNNTQTSFCIGGAGSVVALEVYYAMPFWSIPLVNTPTTTFNGSPVIWIASTASFKNEPFSTGYAGC